MFKQIRKSNPKFKLALNKSSSHRKRFDASSGKEKVVPKSSVKAIVAKSSSVARECSVKNMTDKKIHKRPSGYLADVSSDSLYSEQADSIMDDSLFQDWDEESSFVLEGTYTSTPPRDIERTAVRFGSELEEKDAGVADETCILSGHYPVEDVFANTTMYDIVANDSIELTKKRLPSIVAQGDDEDEDEGEESSYVMEGIVANDSVELTRKRVESDSVVEGNSQFNADASSSFEAEAVFNVPTVIATAPSDKDLMLETEHNIDILEDEDLVWDLPGIIVTSPSDDDITSTDSPESHVVELDYMSIVDQGCKYFPLDGTLHNWNLRFNTGEIFPDHDLRGSGCIEAAGIQLLVSSPSDGDLRVDNIIIIEREFEVADIMDHSYKHHLLDASLHNWSMRFDFENYLRELQGSDDAPCDEDEVY